MEYLECSFLHREGELRVHLFRGKAEIVDYRDSVKGANVRSSRKTVPMRGKQAFHKFYVYQHEKDVFQFFTPV